MGNIRHDVVETENSYRGEVREYTGANEYEVRKYCYFPFSRYGKVEAKHKAQNWAKETAREVIQDGA